MARFITRAALLLAVLSLSAEARSAKVDAGGAEAAEARQSRVLALPAGHAITIEITIGEVRLEAADRQDARIDIVRHAPNDAALARIPVTIDDSSPAIQIRGLQTEDTTEAALRTDITLKLPRTAHVEMVRVLEGKIVITGLGGIVGADIRRGPIEATDLSGTVRLETGIGDVNVRNARLTAGGLLRLRAFNGDVRLTLAERPANARILALALNGTIGSTIPLNMKDTWGPRWGEATLGTGEPVISLDVINGKIAIVAP